MGISLSGGDYQYNRFDAYEKALEEASKPDYLDFDGDGDKEEDMKKALKEKGGSKKKKSKKEEEDEDDKKEDSVDEGYMPLPK